MELVQIKEEREELIEKLRVLENLYQQVCKENSELLKKIARYENLMQKGHLK